MPAERSPLLTRLTLLLAAAAMAMATAWALRTAPEPHSDRYDYLGRAWNLSEGRTADALVVYPLRLAFEGAQELPARNLTRPPLWPALVSAPMRLGLGGSAGVVVAALILFAIGGLVFRSAPPGAGGLAALAVASSFAVWRALLGAGPELALALLLLVVWTWTGSPHPWTRAGVLGLCLGLMPWLHPVGWLYAGLGLLSRTWRDRPHTLAVAALVALVVGLPWYVQAGRSTGTPLTPLQAHAELARAVHDPGGLGPYRTLDPESSLDVLRSTPGAVFKEWGHNLEEQLRHLDGWLGWPLVLVGLMGIRHDRWLALRDLLLLGAGFACVSLVAFVPRLAVPLVPVAALWVGIGAREIVRDQRRALLAGALPVLAVLPWVVPLGLTARPGIELDAIPLALRDPSRATVRAYAEAGQPMQPCFTDSGVLAWRSRRPGVVIPRDPGLVERVAGMPALGQRPVLISTAGPASWWFADPAWETWFAVRAPTALAGTPAGFFVSVEEDVYVPEALSLTAADVPDSLVEIPAPLAVRPGLRVTAATLRSLLDMSAAAAEDGVQLRVTSAYRSFERQSELYSGAIERHGPDQRWVAAPGTSEHQLGTTVDFCDAAMQEVTEPGFAGTAEGRWLAAHAAEFGWVRSYTEENEELSGYRPEPWHYRYGVIDPGRRR